MEYKHLRSTSCHKCRNPVSYTHLFGREQAKQATDSATYIREWEFVGTVDSWENGVAHCQQRGKWSPVSYTHLDVYKRQLRMSSAST